MGISVLSRLLRLVPVADRAGVDASGGHAEPGEHDVHQDEINGQDDQDLFHGVSIVAISVDYQDSR
jgi:hypothetical protein